MLSTSLGTTFFLGLTLIAQTAFATTVYENRTIDTFLTSVYSAGPYNLIGDQVTLAGTDRALRSVTAQFFNLGASGVFDSTATIWDGARTVVLGSSSRSGIFIGEFSSINVTFYFAGISVPDTISVLLGVSNVSLGLDLGLNLFQAPTPGESDDSFYLTSTNSVISSTNTAPGEGNLYMQIEAESVSAVPEPSTWVLVSGGLVSFAWGRIRSASVAATGETVRRTRTVTSFP